MTYDRVYRKLWGFWNGRQKFQYFYTAPMNPDWWAGFVEGTIDRLLLERGLELK